MKKEIFFVFMLLSISCKRDIAVTQTHCTPDNFILAGANMHCMIYRDFKPDIDLSCDNSNSNSLDVDINGDHINDVKIGVSSFSGNTGCIVEPLNTESNKICLNATNIHNGFGLDSVVYFTGNIVQYSLNDTIRSILGYWSPLASTYTIGSRSYNMANESYTVIGYTWNPFINNKYIGFRFVQNADTLYGWLNISISDRHFIIHDCAYQQK